MEKRKLFIGILLPEGFILELSSLPKLNQTMEGIKWTKLENLHITLFFIGFVNEEKLNQIKDEISNLSTLIKVFQITYEGIKLISPAHPKMIWAQFQKNKEFQNFNDFALSRFKEIIPEFNQFHKEPIPHVTLARIKSKNNLKKLDLSNHIKPFSLSVEEFYLMESKSSKEGVRYFPLEKYKFTV